MNWRSFFQHLMWIAFATASGVVVIQGGDRLLGVTLEYFWGIRTFSLAWIADLILVPIAAGITVSCIYGLGGKIIAHLPPLIARVMSYLAISKGYHLLPPDASLLPIGFWGFILIVTVEAGAAGGVIGEIIFKRIYGRTPRHLIYKNRNRKDKDAAATGAVSGPEK